MTETAMSFSVLIKNSMEGVLDMSNFASLCVMD